MKKNKIDKSEIPFIIGAIAFILVGIFPLKNLLNNTVITTGTITSMGSTNNDDPYTDYFYFVDGKKYESTYNGYFAFFHDGQEIKIHYDKDDPTESSIILMDLMMLIFPIIGVLILRHEIREISEENRIRNLKENGELIYADYVSINGENPYNIVCEWYSVVDDKTYTYRSEYLWTNPESIIQEKNISQFPVYVDRNNKSNYIVDIDIVTKNITDLESKE